MFFLSSTPPRSSLFLCSHSSDVLLSYFSHICAKDSFSLLTVTDLSKSSYWFCFLQWIKVLILCFSEASSFPPILSPVLCSWILPSRLLLCSYISTLLLSVIRLTFINLLLAWMGYRLNHWHLFSFSYNALKSSTLPTCKGFLVMHSKPSLDGFDLLIFMDTDWLAIYTVHVQRQLSWSAFCWEACLHSEPLALIEDEWM